MPTQAPAHWSKDYVEHLRTVHLTLVAASVAIVIIVASAKPYNPAVATRQIHQVMELKKLWSPQWIRENGERSFVNKSSSTGPFFKLKGSSKGFEATVRRDKTATFGEDSIVCFRLPTDNYLAMSNAPQISVPDSLSGFEKWWNNLSQSRMLEFPSDIDYTFNTFSLKKEDSIMFEVTGQVPNCERLTVPVELGFLPIGVFPPVYQTVPMPEKPQFPTITIGIDRLEDAAINQKDIVKFFGNWKVGDYRHAFPDLRQATTEIESLEFEDIARILDADAAKGEEVLEVLGIKIPVTQVTSWGSLVLLGIQVYLFLFLRQLSGKLGAQDPGWDVPWVGMDQTKLGQRLLFLTIVLFPCVAICILGARAFSVIGVDYSRPRELFGLQIEGGFWGWTLVSAKATLILLAVIAVCLLAVQSWKNRPRLRNGGRG